MIDIFHIDNRKQYKSQRAALVEKKRAINPNYLIDKKELRKELQIIQNLEIKRLKRQRKL